MGINQNLFGPSNELVKYLGFNNCIGLSIRLSLAASSSTSNNIGNRKTRGRPVKYRFSENDILPLRLTSVDTQSDENDKFTRILPGDPIYICNECKARVWKDEAMRGNKTFQKKVYSICCLNGKVEIPNLHYPPEYLLDLYKGQSDKSKNFIENIRRYNMMFSFTSIGGKIDHKINSGRGPYVYRMYGQNYHLVGSLLPEDGHNAKFLQLYIYDTANESENRITAYGSRNISSNPYSIEFGTVHELQGLLDSVNPLVQMFRMARDRYEFNQAEPIRIKLIGRTDKDGRTYNLPTADEVAALIVGDLDGTTDKRDIILETKSKQLQRISELHVRYLALQYPLLFPYAEDGYRTDVYHKGVESPDDPGHIHLTIREFFAYRLQSRVGEVSLILFSRKLLQQFIVDAYTMVENTRLNYLRNNQKILRASSLTHLYDAQDSCSSNVSDIGNRVVLPSSFTRGARYMRENYLDAMAIV
ncbi:uncharacterized protein [Rutidosis leptorrhynchoides]|uniref:uncharacterized protein n=1 Tax=Rutidosis leptorrhynchoides TaxID=125765 RepID=UPI003A99D5CF